MNDIVLIIKKVFLVTPKKDNQMMKKNSVNQKVSFE